MKNNNKSLTFISHGVVLIVFACLCVLGIWQTQRYFAKQERLETIAQKTAYSAFTFKDVAAYPGEIKDLQITDTIQEFSDKWFWLDNRQIDGQVGYDLIIPGLTDIGWVLVNFGWVKGDKSRLLLPDISYLGTTPMRASGAVVIPGINRFVTETAANDGIFPKRIQQVEFATLSVFSDMKLQPFMLKLTEPSEQFVRRWQPVVMAPEKHIGYALQWFGLAIALLVIYWRVWVKQKGSGKASTSKNG
jgi:surfeit locus 1 family protein